MADNEVPGKPKSSCGCCFLKILAVFLALGVIAMGVVIYFVMNTASWFQTAVQTTPAVYAPLNITPGEKEDVDRVVQKLQTGKAQKELIDETITPAVFNGIVDAIIQGEKDKGKKNDLEDFRLGMDGEYFQVTLTTKPKDANPNSPGTPTYLNIQSTFDLEIQDGKVTKANVQKLSAGGKEAPTLIRFGANKFLEGLRDGTAHDSKNEMKKLGAIKLLKREGDRVHIILDPSKFEQAEDSTPTATPDPTKTPGKEAF